MPAPPTDRRGDAILLLTFQQVDRFRPFALVAPGFAAVDRGECSPDGLLHADAGPVAPYAAVEVQVGRPGTELDPAGTVSVGLATEDDQHVLVTWSAATSRITLSVRRAGRTRVVRRHKVTLAAPFGLAFVLCESQVTALVDSGDGWVPVLTERAKVRSLVDLRRAEVLAGHRYAWGGTAVELGSVRAGLFGMTGLRDPHLVQHADGSPYVREGRCYLTWTCAGPGFFQQAHWSVWSFDPADPAGMRLEAQLFSRRDGLVLGDHAGQLVRDGDRWLVATSSWGDFEPGSIHVRHTESTADLLTGVHVLDTERTPLPSRHGTWDPALTRIGERWHVAYVESRSQRPFTFHPALASTSRADWTRELVRTEEPAGDLSGLQQCEGPILVRSGADTWLLASDGAERSYPVFDLSGARLGRLDAPYGTNIPHPQVLPDPAGGWWLLTFDGTAYHRPMLGYGGHGDVLVLHADPPTT